MIEVNMAEVYINFRELTLLYIEVKSEIKDKRAAPLLFNNIN
jgi:hypothetical protein